eukprot:m.627425 g.627425  ORF g.627425 m.627425 type:complete len:712 (-) comp58254_c0_seq13:946-3081(-)
MHAHALPLVVEALIPLCPSVCLLTLFWSLCTFAERVFAGKMLMDPFEDGEPLTFHACLLCGASGDARNQHYVGDWHPSLHVFGMQGSWPSLRMRATAGNEAVMRRLNQVLCASCADLVCDPVFAETSAHFDDLPELSATHYPILERRLPPLCMQCGEEPKVEQSSQHAWLLSEAALKRTRWSPSQLSRSRIDLQAFMQLSVLQPDFPSDPYPLERIGLMLAHHNPYCLLRTMKKATTDLIVHIRAHIHLNVKTGHAGSSPQDHVANILRWFEAVISAAQIHSQVCFPSSEQFPSADLAWVLYVTHSFFAHVYADEVIASSISRETVIVPSLKHVLTILACMITTKTTRKLQVARELLRNISVKSRPDEPDFLDFDDHLDSDLVHQKSTHHDHDGEDHDDLCLDDSCHAGLNSRGHKSLCPCCSREIPPVVLPSYRDRLRQKLLARKSKTDSNESPKAQHLAQGSDHRSIDELLSFIEGSKPGKKKEKAKPKEIEPSAKNATFSSPATPAVNLDKQKDTSPGKAALTGTPAPLQSQVAVSSPTPSPAAKASTSPPIATATVPAARAGARPDPSSTVSQQLDVKDTSSLQNETSSQNKTPPKESPVVVTEKPKSKRQLKKLQQQQQRQTAASLMQEMLEVDSVEKVFAPMDDLSLVTDESDRELELFKQFCSFNSPVRLRIPVKFSQDARFALDYTVSSGVSMKATSQICGLT